MEFANLVNADAAQQIARMITSFMLQNISSGLNARRYRDDAVIGDVQVEYSRYLTQLRLNCHNISEHVSLGIVSPLWLRLDLTDTVWRGPDYDHQNQASCQIPNPRSQIPDPGPGVLYSPSEGQREQ